MVLSFSVIPEQLPQAIAPASTFQATSSIRRHGHQDRLLREEASPHIQHHAVHPDAHDQSMDAHHVTHQSNNALVHAQNTFHYDVYAANIDPHGRNLHDTSSGPPQTWETSALMTQQTQTPLVASQQPHFRRETWASSYGQASQTTHGMVPTATVPSYDFRYRDSQQDWVDSGNEFYSQPQVSNKGLTHQSTYVGLKFACIVRAV